MYIYTHTNRNLNSNIIGRVTLVLCINMLLLNLLANMQSASNTEGAHYI